MSGVYDVFVKISMTNGVSPGLALISKEVLGLNVSVSKLTKAFNEMSTGAKLAFGGAAIAGGIAMVNVLKDVANHGDELLDQQDKLRRAGVSQNDILAQQAKYYRDIAKAVPTSTVSGYLKTFNEMRSVVGADHAAEVTPWAMKLEAIIANATGKSAEGEGFKLWRALEMTGKTISDPQLVSKMANAFAQDIIGSAGKLDANTYQLMAKRGGVAWANAKPEFLSGPMSVVAADMGGDAAGTAMMSGYMFLTGANTLSKQQYAALTKLHLIDPKKVTWDNAGHANVGPGGIVGSDKYTGEGKFDLYGWAHNVLEPALQNASKSDRMIADSFIAKIGRNRGVMRMLNMFTDSSFGEQFEKENVQWGQAKGVDEAYAGLVNDDSKGVKKAFADQYESMMQSIGAPVMQMAIPVMKGTEDMFRAIGTFSNSHPGAIKLIAEGIAGLAAVMVSAGVASILAALGPAGWIAAGLTAIGIMMEKLYQKSKPLFLAAAFGLGPVGIVVGEVIWLIHNFERLKDPVKLLGDALHGLETAFSNALKAITDFLAGLGGIGRTPIPGMQHMPGSVDEFGRPAYTAPSTAAPGKQSSLTIINNNIIDGKVVAQSVEKHIVNGSQYPTRAPMSDGFTMPSYG